MQEVLTTCKQLKCFYYASSFNLQPLLVQNNLQQSCITTEGLMLPVSTRDTKFHFDDNFMNMVSAHGGLIHVVFAVDSVISKGVATLIKIHQTHPV